jgi:hypothetical protein
VKEEIFPALKKKPLSEREKKRREQGVDGFRAFLACIVIPIHPHDFVLVVVLGPLMIDSTRRCVFLGFRSGGIVDIRVESVVVVRVAQDIFVVCVGIHPL